MTRKAIIIGASSGIGRALAGKLAEDGYSVGITARRTGLLEELATGTPGVSLVRQMDISNPQTAIPVLEEMIRTMGAVDLVVVNAGISSPNPELLWEPERETIEVNVTGFAAMANVAMRYFLAQGSGHLVGISSVAALRGSPDAPAYNASKAFVSRYLDGLRIRASQAGGAIVVTEVRPGIVDTEMTKGRSLFWAASPEVAARQIASDIRRRKKRSYVTRRWCLAAWLVRILPESLRNRP